MVTPVAATTITNNTTTTSSLSEIELSPQPVYQEQEKLVSQIPQADSFMGDRAWNWNADFAKRVRKTIRTISTKSGTLSMLDGTYAGKEIFTTEEDGARVQQQQFMKQCRLHVKRRG